MLRLQLDLEQGARHFFTHFFAPKNMVLPVLLLGRT